jgi:putative membrane protein
MILKLLARWILIALGILLIPQLLSGITVETFYIALVLAFVFGFINAIIRPILVLVTLPINIITLGLFTLVINGFLFYIPSTFIKGFSVEGPLWAIAGAFLVSVFSWVAGKIIAD